MTKITVDPTTKAQLVAVDGPSALIDEHGKVLGYFMPEVEPSLYRTVVVPFSDEEIAEAAKQTGGRPLKDILRDLENRS